MRILLGLDWAGLKKELVRKNEGKNVHTFFLRPCFQNQGQRYTYCIRVKIKVTDI